jgi:dolichyl-phosphate-mannose--protein O-mannosyl transferase
VSEPRPRRAGRRSLLLLAVVSLVSFGVRIAWIGEPCRAPCATVSQHLLIFDEHYYVNAARVIAGLRPPAGAPYAGSPAGVDPNSEHPQLAKLVIAGSMELFGDGPVAWRIGSLLAGSIAILGLFALVLAAGGTEWQALGASTLMAADTMLLVNSRIGTLDVYAVAAVVWAAAVYLRGRPLAAGSLLGLGACAKEVASFVLLVFVWIELLRWLRARRGGKLRRPWPARLALGRLALSLTSAAIVFLGLLDVLDRIAPPYDASAHKLIGGGPFAHVAHILSFASGLTIHASKGITSYPWQWLVDYKPISYLVVNPAQPTPGLRNVQPAVHFLGLISPPILLAALAGLAVAGATVLALGSGRRWARTAVAADELAVLSLAWVAGTWLPFTALSLIASRTSYIYYMTLVMPGMYTAVVHLIERHRPGRRVAAGLAVLTLLTAIALYPFTPLPFGW